MDGSDEFDGQGDAPLPPYERMWRHPAEVSDENRQRHFMESAPPPVGRRVTALVAFVSLVASAVILLVAVPKGIDGRSTSPENSSVASVRSTTTVPAKGSGAVTSGATPAIAIDSHTVICAGNMGDAGEGTVMLADGTKVATTFVAAVEDFGISLRHTDDDITPEVNALTDDEFKYLGDEGRLKLLLDNGAIANTSLGIATESARRWWPLSIQSGLPTGGLPIARIVDEENNLVGVAVRRNHGVWAVKIADLLALVSDGDGDARNG